MATGRIGGPGLSRLVQRAIRHVLPRSSTFQAALSWANGLEQANGVLYVLGRQLRLGHTVSLR